MTGAVRLAVVLKGYPRLSETFIAQEILELERRGFAIDIWSLRRPTDRYVHPMHKAIEARLFYLPEYLHDAPLRVAIGALAAFARPVRLLRTLGAFARDLARDFSASRVRRLGQAFVLARELDPAIDHLHVHFLHTPGSVVRYCARLTGRTFSFSAHARDIWITPAWDLADKIGEADWGVTCTRSGLAELRRVGGEAAGRVALAYHGLDLSRFPAPPERSAGADGSDAARPVRIVSVGRAVAKKGFDDLLDALAALPSGLHWHFDHVGSGALLAELKARAERLGLAGRVTWHGGRPQTEVIDRLRAADIFVLASKPDGEGDRDGLPNVLMEAASQRLAMISTTVSGIPEFLTHGVNGVLVAPAAPAELARAIEELARSPAERERLGLAAEATLRSAFSFEAGIDLIAARLSGHAVPLEETPSPAVVPVPR